MCKKLILPVVVALALVAGSAQADLVGHWTFDEGEGTTAYDSSGNDYHGTLQGDPQWVTGNIGGALEFDGTGDYVEVPDSEGLHLWERFTLAAWIYQVESRSSRIIDKATAGTSNGPHMDTHPGTKIRSCSGTCNSTASDHTLDEWHHVAVTFDEGDVKLYVDGSIEGEGSTSSPLAGNSIPLRIGADSNAQNLFHGLIDDVRVYNHALTETEIRAAMVGEAVAFAFGPNPANGSMVGQASVTLQWRPGDFAVSHDVYFGESLDDVNQATPEGDAFQGNQTATQFPLPDLTPGATYYWRVDEVNDANAASPWKGNVWSFWIQPATAWDPAPTDGVEFVNPAGDLTWNPGLGTLFHTVYVGESFDEVNDATTGGFMIADAAYAPGSLELDKIYYWRVDEFTMTGTVKGEVWSFRTMPEIPVADDPNLILWYTLDEGSGTTAVDWSGHEHHGTIFGQPQWADGVHGGALDFDGVSTGIDMSDRVVDTTFTLAMWLKPRDIPYTTGYYAVLHNDQWNAGSVHVHLRANTSLYGTDINGGGAVISTTVLRADEWYHLASLIDAAGTENQLYVNGILESTAAPVGTPYLGPLNFGAWTNNQRFYHGLMDDIRIYDDLLTEEEIQQLLRGNPLLAWTPDPDRDAIVDIRNATSLSWLAGDTAASHDVYFGNDRDALAAAGDDSAEYQGNQPGMSLSLAGRVEFGGGDYFWRIDEVEADETVHAGNIWRFTVPDYLVVEDFESYSNEVGSRVFEKWIDGIGFTLPEPGHPGNDTGAAVGHDVWSVDSPYFEGTIMETANVHGGGQAMPIYYDNTFAAGPSEADLTFTPAQNWTVEGVTTLVVYFRGEADNTGDLYVKINGVKVPYDGDPADIAGGEWIAWEIDLASVGVSLTNITTLTIGIEGGETGVLYIDDIILTKP